MQLKFLSKVTQPKQFHFSPRFYDERKERLELKKAQFDALKQKELTAEERKDVLRNAMQESWSRTQNSAQIRKSYNIRILLLILFLLALGYFVLNGLDDVDTVVRKLV
jgi:hypothetical protein